MAAKPRGILSSWCGIEQVQAKLERVQEHLAEAKRPVAAFRDQQLSKPSG